MTARGARRAVTALCVAGGALALTGCANDPPTASFTLDPNPTSGQTVTFNGSASTGGRDENDQPIAISRWEWDLDGNGSFDKATSGPTVKHTYHGSETIEVGLRVVNVRNVASPPTTRAVVTSEQHTAVAPVGADCDPGAYDHYSCSSERLTGSPLGDEDEPVDTGPAPNWSQSPSFGSFFGGNFGDPLQSDRVTVAVGGDRVFVLNGSARPGSGTVRKFDATSLVDQGSFYSIADARDIAFYRNEVYVVAADGDVAVFDRDGNPRRVLRMVHPLGATTQTEETKSWALTVAWGEVWTTISLGIKRGTALLARDARTGAFKSVGAHNSREGCWLTVKNAHGYETCYDTNPFDDAYNPDSEWPATWVPGISASPEWSALINQCRAYQRSTLLGVVYGAPSQNESGVTWTCEHFDNSGYIMGTESVWGRSHFLQMTDSEDYGPEVREYSIYGRSDGTVDITPTRGWKPQDLRPGVFRDIAYRTRDARVDWSGTLTEDPSPWLHSPGSAEDKCLHYVVSDADIYVTGTRGERWYEPARALTNVELVIDGRVIKQSTLPEGDFCINTRGVYNGWQIPTGNHTVEVRAHLSNPTRVIKSVNANLRTDDTPPAGFLVSPETVARGATTFTGQVSDAHAGPGAWHLEIQRPGQTGWERVCSGQRVPDTPDYWSCAWNTANGQYPDGDYQVRATMVDRATDGGNSAQTGSTAVEVDNVQEEPAGDGGIALDPSDQAFDETWDDDGLPDTASESGAPEDEEFTAGQAEPDHGASYQVSCPPTDEWIEEVIPTYGPPDQMRNPVKPTPEAAVLDLMASNVMPPVPSALLQPEEKAGDHAVFAARVNNSIRAFVVVENDPDLGWIGTYYQGCSTFPEELVPVAIP